MAGMVVIRIIGELIFMFHCETKYQRHVPFFYFSPPCNTLTVA